MTRLLPRFAVISSFVVHSPEYSEPGTVVNSAGCIRMLPMIVVGFMIVKPVCHMSRRGKTIQLVASALCLIYLSDGLLS